MKNIALFLKKFFFTTTALYTVTSLFFSVFGKNLRAEGNLQTQVNFLYFAIISSIVFTCVSYLKINNVLKGVINAILSYVSFVFVFFALRGKLSEIYSLTVISIVYVLVYLFCALVCNAVNCLTLAENKKDEYKNVFSDIEK